MMYKFRTMSNAKDSNGELLPDAQRLGRLGRFLRKSSLDELPELFNVRRAELLSEDFVRPLFRDPGYTPAGFPTDLGSLERNPLFCIPYRRTHRNVAAVREIARNP